MKQTTGSAGDEQTSHATAPSWHRIALICTLALVVAVVASVALRGYHVEPQLRASGRQRHALTSTGNDCVVVYGTRPELIKVIPIIRLLRADESLCNLVVVSSGQHKQLLQPLEQYFDLVPDVDLHLMQAGGDLATLASRGLDEFVALWSVLQPRFVYVQGDTTTALMAGTAAFHHNIDVLHVEAGLRTGQLASPYPEEFNRQSLGLICTLCFAPTQLAADALRREAVAEARIALTGNTVVDSLQYSLAHPPPTIASAGAVTLTALAGPPSRAGQLVVQEQTAALLRKGQHVVLLTAHRRENARDGGFQALGQAVAKLAQRHPTVQWLFALHYNPAVREVILPLLGDIDNVWLVAPPAYPEFVQLLRRVTLIVSDSGGLQEEGLALGIPTLITRTNTERMEGVLAGGAQLVGNRGADVEAAVDKLLQDKAAYEKMAAAPSPYGDGTAAQQIIAATRKWRSSVPSWKKHVAASALLRGAAPSLAPQAPTASAAPAAQRATPTPFIKYPASPKHAFEYRKNELTVILTGYARSAAILELQLKALDGSTLRPSQVVLFQNTEQVDYTKVLAKWPKVRHVHYKNWNSKFHGRFTAALLVDTEFVAIADDTNVPGKKWLEAAVGAANDTNGIIGNSGRNIEVSKLLSNPNKFYQSARDSTIVGHARPEPIQVDFVGHWWVCRTAHIRSMWHYAPASLYTAEDIHLSAAAMIFNGAKTYVLDVPSAEYHPELGVPASLLPNDKPASLVPGTNEERLYAAQYWIQRGWTPLSLLPMNKPPTVM